MANSPRALLPPDEPVVLLTNELVERTLAASRTSPRKRMLMPFHKSHDERLHRMFNAVQPGTYVRPHRHLATDKHEVFLLLRGAVDFLVFDDDGSIRLARRLVAGSDEFGIDLAPDVFHSLIVRAPDTLFYEVKEGPYRPSDDKDFAPWAPPEEAPEVAEYVAHLERELALRAAR
jgi:cupin fold WbuC family metalloprotein